MKKIPSRTCIGCGTQKSKTELIRIVKTQSGEIKLDKTGKLPGRGAYICDKSECLNLAIRSKKLEKTFETAREFTAIAAVRTAEPNFAKIFPDIVWTSQYMNLFS